MAPITRARIRLPCDIPAEITFTGSGSKHTRKALISNISTTGVQLLSPAFIATGQTVKITFHLPGQKKKFLSESEVMRVESLQRKTTQYPYALGAKLIHPEPRQEKRIARFISGRATLASTRFIWGNLLIVLACVHFLRALLHTHFLSIGVSEADLIGSSSIPFFNWLIHPGCSALIAAGTLCAGVFCIFNRPTLAAQAVIGCGIGAISSLLRLYAKKDFIVLGEIPKWIWPGELLFLGIQAISILGIIYLSVKLHQIRKTLLSAKPGLGRPTFTIL